MADRVLGVDIGSTTVKVVVAEGGEVLHRAYQRHRGRCLEVARELIALAPAASRRIATGSASSTLARELDATYVHEVHAVAAAVKAVAPAARTVIELGGQDAKMIHLESGGFTSEMNERCAAGTGAVLDRCVHRLGLDLGALRSLEVRADRQIEMVSAKCGVFAETDLIAMVKAGRSVDDVLTALLDAIVRGNLNALARGRPLAPQVVLLGGPHAFIPALAQLWRLRLAERWTERGVEAGEVIVPPGAEYFAASGAIACADEVDRVASIRRRRSSTVPPPMPAQPLPSPDRRGPTDASRPRGEVSQPAQLLLGLDAGSTTVKAVALAPNGDLVASAYLRAGHNPLEDARDVLATLRKQLNPTATITAFGVTGYAADLVGPVLGADAAPVETLAHARSARHFVPDAQVVCDVGGQDIKVLMLDGDGVSGFRLSQQCAAGNGALLDAAASELGVPIERYAQVASSAQRAPRFSAGCAVFVDTERVTAQRDGYSPAEILAGLAAVLPRNIWENVAAANDLAELGDVFVLSGGVQRNAAAVAAQTHYLTQRHPAARVHVHPCPGEAGAIGAALLAQAELAGASRFIGFDRVALTHWQTASGDALRCRACLSHCARTQVTASSPGGEPRSFVTGQGCERGETWGLPSAPRRKRASSSQPALNLLRAETTQLFGRVKPVKVATDRGRHLRVALPRVLPMYRAAPLFTHYLEALGVPREAIVISPTSSEELWRRHGGHGTVDACYPAKVTQAHVASLLAGREQHPFDVLFFPVLTHALTAVTGCADTAACPVVAGTPFVTRTSFGFDEHWRLRDGTRLLSPTLPLCHHTELSDNLFAAMLSVLPGLTRLEHSAALIEGFAAQKRFEASLEEQGAQAIMAAAAARRCAVVMIGRPYHADPGLHHELGSELQALGRTTMSLRALPKKREVLDAIDCEASNDLAEAAPSLTNSGDGEKLSAVRLVASHPFLVGLEVSSFKCGQDSALYGEIAERARQGGKPFLALHELDETRPVASLRLRLRTFLDAVQRWERAQQDERQATG